MSRRARKYSGFAIYALKIVVHGGCIGNGYPLATFGTMLLLELKKTATEGKRQTTSSNAVHRDEPTNENPELVLPEILGYLGIVDLPRFWGFQVEQSVDPEFYLLSAPNDPKTNVVCRSYPLPRLV